MNCVEKLSIYRRNEGKEEDNERNKERKGKRSGILSGRFRNEKKW
jgi:hypothetical protein